MKIDFSIASQPISTAAVTLKAVYELHADSTYDVKKRLTGTKDIVALRTFGGAGDVVIEGWDEIKVTPGSLIFFEHKQIMRYYCSGAEWNFWWFEFTTDGSLNLPLNSLNYIEFTDNELCHCESCLELLRKGNNISSVMASAMLSELLYTWQTLYKENDSICQHEKAVQNAIEYMRSSMHETITVRDMAHIAGYSERRFRQLFEEIIGTRPKQYYDYMRINIAEELLRNTSLSIAQIAGRLGFSSQFHFTRMFLQKKGIQPSKIRK